MPHRRVLWAVLLLGCALSALLVVRHRVDGWVVAVAAWAGTAMAAGDAIRSRRAYAAAIAERAQRAEETREEEAKRRVAEERMRIARELHDVVAHQIALANVQAGVAAHVMDRRPDQARQALAHVSEASRSALDELRATVGCCGSAGSPRRRWSRPPDSRRSTSSSTASGRRGCRSPWRTAPAARRHRPRRSGCRPASTSPPTG